MDFTKQKTILLVEDQAIIALNDSLNLREYGYNVIHALTGGKAIEAVNDKDNPIDLILMDINLGEELDGTEIARMILKDNDLPIIFHSSYIERDIVDRTENISSYGYVVKNGITVLDASIKMAFRLHESYHNLKKQKAEFNSAKNELQMYEKRYRRLFESAKDGILILNADSGMIVDVNPFLIKLLGFSKEQFLKKNIWDIGTFKNIGNAKQLFKELQEKEYVRYEDLPLETYAGEQVHVEFVSNVYLVDDEKVIQCNIRDITERKKHEKILAEELDKNQSLLKELQHRSKNSFAMITSLIRLSANITHTEETQATLKELTLRVKSISDLYLLLHEADNFFEVDLKAYTNKIIESMGNLSQNIIINKELDEIVIPPKNAASIGMILVELISNSFKYAFPNSAKGKINIELKQVNSGILLVVEDDGIGLDKDFDIEKINSLGLHLVNLMVDQLNGSIKFITEKGTKIIIEFPV